MPHPTHLDWWVFYTKTAPRVETVFYLRLTYATAPSAGGATGASVAGASGAGAPSTA